MENYSKPKVTIDLEEYQALTKPKEDDKTLLKCIVAFLSEVNAEHGVMIYELDKSMTKVGYSLELSTGHSLIKFGKGSKVLKYTLNGIHN